MVTPRLMLLLPVAAALAGCGLDGPPIRPEPKPGTEAEAPDASTAGEVSVEGGGFIEGPITED